MGRERGWEDGRGGERERDGDVLGVNLHYSLLHSTMYIVHVHVYMLNIEISAHVPEWLGYLTCTCMVHVYTCTCS